VGAVRRVEADEAAANREALQHVIEAARDALSQEFERAERYDAKARNQMTVAGSWFAVAQAVAAVGPNTPGEWIAGILLAAVVAAVFLILATIASAKVWKLRDQPAVSQETLEDMLAAARKSANSFGEDLVRLYRHLLGHAQSRNEERAAALDGSLLSWWCALGFGFVEVCVALLSKAMSV
jgi:hypothetical protein